LAHSRQRNWPAGEDRARLLEPISVLVSERHFLDHVAPIWHALPAERHGVFLVTRAELLPWAELRGIKGAEVLNFGLHKARAPGPFLTASSGDLRRIIDRWGPATPQIYLNHGAGFSWPGEKTASRHTSYAGGNGPLNCVGLFLDPNRYAATRNQEAHPRAMVRAVGCPKLDIWHNAPPKSPDGNGPLVCISFHWHPGLAVWGNVPETDWAWNFYCKIIPQLPKHYRMIGHGHPRAISFLRRKYKEAGFETLTDFEDVLAQADVYVNDSSSTLYEFASLDRPVVVMNAPIYRRHIHHGLRFWEHEDVGVICNKDEQLIDAIAQAIEDPPEQRELRHAATEDVYPVRGKAAQAAVEAIQEFCNA
jgi:hypothetical protein